MYGQDEDDRCGHHCDSDCPKCGEDRPRRPVKRARVVKRAKNCLGNCEGAEHNHGCPAGM